MIFRPTFEEDDHPDAAEAYDDSDLWDEVPDEDDPTEDEENELPTASE